MGRHSYWTPDLDNICGIISYYCSIRKKIDLDNGKQNLFPALISVEIMAIYHNCGLLPNSTIWVLYTTLMK
jgi:hypothetical protein